MNNRIKSIASYIETNDKVADIGCDHALLSIYLAQNKIHSIAIDINKRIIENNIETINNLKLNKYIEFRIGNGTKQLKFNEADTLVMAGLGTYTIYNIIKDSKYKFNKIITISNKNHSYLRKKMLEIGYKVLLEEIITDKNKFYNLIIFIPGSYNYSEEELTIGLNHKNKDNLIKYHKYITECYEKYSNFRQNKNIEKLVDLIKNYKY